jgi:hypothetical protein
MRLDLSGDQKRLIYFDRAPTLVELRPERSPFSLRRGLAVRSSPHPGAEPGPSGVWHPLEKGGIVFDWGTGFAGFTVVFARSGSGYVGKAETYADVEGVRVESSAASLDAVICNDADARKDSYQTPSSDSADDAIRDEMELVARTCLADDRLSTKVYDAREFFPWVSVGRLYGVVSGRSHRHVYAAALGGGGTPTCLTGGSKEVLGDYLSRQFQGRFPGLQLVPQIGEFLNDVVLPRGTVVGDQKLRDDERRWVSRTGKGSWTGRGAREKDIAAFKRLCTGVRGSASGNEWRLEFNAFRPDGGVDVLTASGASAPLTIVRITVEEVQPAGEFYYPFE